MIKPRQVLSFKNSAGNVLSVSGIALTLIGLLHVPVWILDGGSWSGAVSWRKPILFGISTGVTLISLGWLNLRLKKNAADRLVAWVVAVSLVLEVALITIQQWRSKASHFNQDTFVDAVIDNTMFALIVVAFAGIIYFTLRSFGKLRLTRDYRLAMRGGMLFLVVSCCIGFVISFYGYSRVSAGLSPEMVGEGGVTKFPHGIAIHALQILPAIVCITRFTGIESAKRQLLVWSVIVSFALQITFASYQTIYGLGRFEIMTATGTALALLSIGIPAVTLLFALKSFLRPSTKG